MKISTPLLLVKDHYTPEDLPHLGGDALVELVDGQLIECEVDPLSSNTVAHLAGRIFDYLQKSKAGTKTRHE